MKISKLKTPLTPFQILFLIPLALFLLSVFIGEIVRLYRLHDERLAFSQLTEIDELFEELSMSQMFQKYGYDFRDKMGADERLSTGLEREYWIERKIPKFLFFLLILLYPGYSILTRIGDLVSQEKGRRV
ncbi:hypothetical protein LEP1GSC047_3165 [Leptospira inadai serovar Lyme str. 10]|uniref:Uncharacterized protein n=2 Tax=Leptospira inadai serovar Lyme TaxID=293084 RepID=V6HC15_9LEPT|nr:hypothetical protein [Leptospira inadai]EQA36293.1 hypothetical protein LEP1GSC047_3165 [Leptospira inadai serovar Lyme str. 10]PNV71794.1 hypothetical protein BES34_020755 [Leptospira inadai serovar Lyme]